MLNPVRPPRNRINRKLDKPGEIHSGPY
jgi:hypothetical protein